MIRISLLQQFIFSQDHMYLRRSPENHNRDKTKGISAHKIQSREINLSRVRVVDYCSQQSKSSKLER